jgi:hypothetical protein
VGARNKIVQRVEYPGELGIPIREAIPFVEGTSLLGGYTEEGKANARRRDLEELNRKLQVLAQHYEARGGDGEINWKRLAISLALAHVPGLQVVEELPRGRGRPKRYVPSYERYALYSAILAILDEGEPSVANACRRLSKREGKWRGANPRTLEARFHEDARTIRAMKLPPPMSMTPEEREGNPFLALLIKDRTGLASAKYPQPPAMLSGLFGLGSRLYDHNKS